MTTKTSDFDYLEYDSSSGYEVGEEGMLISVMQSVIGAKETGLWTAENESAYRQYAYTQNWRILKDILSSNSDFIPSFWDMGIVSSEDLLDIDF